MRQKIELQQDVFRSGCLSNENLIEHIQAQSCQLRNMAFDESQSDSLEISDTVPKLDFGLLRYACALMVYRLEETATHDCAQLIAESVLDVTGKNARQRWENWLESAPCWPRLASDKWPHAVVQAAEVVVERLEALNVIVNRAVSKDIKDAVAQLELRDLVLPETFARYFPEPSSENEETDEG